MITQLRIGTTDVILNDYEPGKGKIIISDDDFGYNFSYYWGSMGKDSLKEFLSGVDIYYFVNKLGSHENGDIDMDKTMRAVRKFWKEDSGCKWYEFIEEQKELREKFNDLQKTCTSAHEFVDAMNNIDDNFYFSALKPLNNFQCALQLIKNEPWHFIQYEQHKHNRWLTKFFPLLKQAISS